ncbi:MAG: biopolymer transporter ExbD, partial [Hyphomicrobiales bacterium]|nr:biopolymer transporter ExbD [Hyphomicrobiales bacterium]
ILPLINVVFLLLIFFMLAGRLSAGDPFRVDPPASVSADPAEQRDLVVLVGADGRLALDGEVVEQSALSARLKQRLGDGGNGLVRVKADAAVEALQVVEVMEVLRDAGVERLKLLTVPETR